MGGISKWQETQSREFDSSSNCVAVDILCAVRDDLCDGGYVGLLMNRWTGWPGVRTGNLVAYAAAASTRWREGLHRNIRLLRSLLQSPLGGPSILGVFLAAGNHTRNIRAIPHGGGLRRNCPQARHSFFADW